MGVGRLSGLPARFAVLSGAVALVFVDQAAAFAASTLPTQTLPNTPYWNTIRNAFLDHGVDDPNMRQAQALSDYIRDSFSADRAARAAATGNANADVPFKQLAMRSASGWKFLKVVPVIGTIASIAELGIGGYFLGRDYGLSTIEQPDPETEPWRFEALPHNGSTAGRIWIPPALSYGGGAGTMLNGMRGNNNAWTQTQIDSWNANAAWAVAFYQHVPYADTYSVATPEQSNGATWETIYLNPSRSPAGWIQPGGASGTYWGINANQRNEVWRGIAAAPANGPAYKMKRLAEFTGKPLNAQTFDDAVATARRPTTEDPMAPDGGLFQPPGSAPPGAPVTYVPTNEAPAPGAPVIYVTNINNTDNSVTINEAAWPPEGDDGVQEPEPVPTPTPAPTTRPYEPPGSTYIERTTERTATTIIDPETGEEKTIIVEKVTEQPQEKPPGRSFVEHFFDKAKTKAPFDWFADATSSAAEIDLEWVGWQGMEHDGQSIEQRYDLNWLKPYLTAVGVVCCIGLGVVALLWI